MIGFLLPSGVFSEELLGEVIKFKHKTKLTTDILRVNVVVNDIGSEDPRPVALWLSDDPIFEPGDRFLVEEVISDYERAPGMVGMPVRTKLKFSRAEELEGKFAIITIGTVREIFEKEGTGVAIVRKIGQPDCISDLFLREDEPNDDFGQEDNLGSLKRDYCVLLAGTMSSDASSGSLRDIDRYRVRVKESLHIRAFLNHGDQSDFDLSVAMRDTEEILAVCESIALPEDCVFEVEVVDEPVNIELIVIAASGLGPYSMTLKATAFLEEKSQLQTVQQGK